MAETLSDECACAT